MSENACAACKKTPPQGTKFNKCSRCMKTFYCSAACQKTDWKCHKMTCGKSQKQNADTSTHIGDVSPMEYIVDHVKHINKGKPLKHTANTITPIAPVVNKSPIAKIDNPYTRIDNGTYLYECPEEDVFKLLIDAFRLRQEDAFQFLGKSDPGTLYTGQFSSDKAFIKFLSTIERRKRKVLPTWWSDEKKQACVEFGMKDKDWSSLKKTVTKDGINQHYGLPNMSMQLRMFGEEALNEPAPGKTRGTGKEIRQALMKMEDGKKKDEENKDEEKSGEQNDKEKSGNE